MYKTAIGIAAALMASAASAQVFDLGQPANTNVGSDETFTSGSYSVTASGYSAPGVDEDLYVKNLGGDEVGLGLTGDPHGQNEIYSNPNGNGGTAFVQLDVSQLLAVASGATFAMDSTTDGEWWEVFGSNTDGAGGGTLVNFGNDELSQALGGWGSYNYYNFYSVGTLANDQWSFGNVLLSAFAVTPSVPEPATWAMMLLGFGAVGFAMRRNRKTVALAQVA